MAINIDFYQVQEQTGTTLQSVFEAIAKTDPLQRTRKAGNEYASIVELIKDGDVWLGTIVKIRMNQIPRKASLSGVVEDFDLKDDEGVGEEVSFLYDPAPKIRALVLQYNHYGVRAGSFREYVSHFMENAIFDLYPILTTDALVRMSKKKIIKKIEVQFAAPKNSNIFADADTNTKSLIDILHSMAGGKIYMEVSADKGKDESLSFKPIQRIIQTMLGHREEVQILKLHGKETENESTKPIDLLHDRMVETIAFRQTRQNPLTREQMYSFLKEAYNRRRGEINQQFLIDGD
ncbi:DUF6731 family protein [Effusibacillus pohliae]|uniref:DUF6731 family protein n=1 Tax=Effusibacillus pohliae TaxID=232270 RepID=UPI0003617E15|nr:DUF6731 family protein [Effusibacillus pohliae]